MASADGRASRAAGGGMQSSVKWNLADDDVVDQLCAAEFARVAGTCSVVCRGALLRFAVADDRARGRC